MMWLAAAHAASWSVPTDGAFDTLNLASGDEVVFTEDTTLCVNAGLDLTLSGEVTLTADGCETLLIANDGETLVVQGLTLHNDAGRVAGSWSSHLVLDGITVEEGGVAIQGGAVHAYGGSLSIVDSVFAGVTGSDGGAVAAIWVTELSITGTHFVGNDATGHGGALFTYAIDGPVTLESNRFELNGATDGGAIAAHWYHQMVIEDCTFDDNFATGRGGAMTHWYNSDATIINSRFTSNSAGGDAGAISAYGGTRDDWSLTVLDSLFEGSVSGGNGGAIDASWMQTVDIQGTTFSGGTSTGSGAGLRTYAIGTLDVGNSVFWGGVSQNRGGGLETEWNSVETVRNTLFGGNEAALGGGIARYAGYDSELTNNTFVDNVATSWGGAAYLEWSYGRFTNNLVVGSEGTGLYVAEAYSLGNTTFGWNGWYENDIHGGGFGHPGAADVLADPLFLAADDYRLHLTSPLRDAGDPDFLDPDGTVSDIGAWGGPGAANGDLDLDGLAYFEDCDDSDPGLSEPVAWYDDVDGDGYAGEAATLACYQPEGMVLNWNDCDDGDPDAYPGALEHRGDGIDQDCDGEDPAARVPERTEVRRSCSSTGPVSAGWLALAGLLLMRR